MVINLGFSVLNNLLVLSGGATLVFLVASEFRFAPRGPRQRYGAKGQILAGLVLGAL